MLFQTQPRFWSSLRTKKTAKCLEIQPLNNAFSYCNCGISRIIQSIGLLENNAHCFMSWHINSLFLTHHWWISKTKWWLLTIKHFSVRCIYNVFTHWVDEWDSGLSGWQQPSYFINIRLLVVHDVEAWESPDSEPEKLWCYDMLHYGTLLRLGNHNH